MIQPRYCRAIARKRFRDLQASQIEARQRALHRKWLKIFHEGSVSWWKIWEYHGTWKQEWMMRGAWRRSRFCTDAMRIYYRRSLFLYFREKRHRRSRNRGMHFSREQWKLRETGAISGKIDHRGAIFARRPRAIVPKCKPEICLRLIKASISEMPSEWEIVAINDRSTAHSAVRTEESAAREEWRRDTSCTLRAR